MTDKQIKIEDYFNIMRDDYGRIYGIQDIGDTKELIKAIREQNEYIKAKEQECERWKSNFYGKVSAIEELIQIIQQALKDFSIEIGTPQYDRLLKNAKELGIEVKDYE